MPKRVGVPNASPSQVTKSSLLITMSCGSSSGTSELAVIETSHAVQNHNLYKKLSSKSVLCWIRTIVARLTPHIDRPVTTCMHALERSTSFSPGQHAGVGWRLVG